MVSTDDIAFYVEELKITHTLPNLIELRDEFGKIVGYKINM